MVPTYSTIGTYASRLLSYLGGQLCSISAIAYSSKTFDPFKAVITAKSEGITQDPDLSKKWIYTEWRLEQRHECEEAK